ncbi:hypothetical protein [Acanthamoeba polyphaga mimivirus]|uniref:Uncharacterized protein n=3 Tax=Megamimivirinae TaxID=3044648 RepID=A0A2L2DII0_MIMIV|nr:hypothetical protein MegaChil _gp0237 [Megavirus chiliensis]AEQ33010.1 hypothetical protein [Megavirus chiliensis]AFX92272.1 hypothetical protein CE11_00242 [Megavirus courdo11]AVG45972.1 hypothetical protein [Acanthamoeba polyphaga mimivirus]AVG47074.1 hypothetical protein [Acanthamoeba polyphaga mimivirus]
MNPTPHSIPEPCLSCNEGLVEVVHYSESHAAVDRQKSGESEIKSQDKITVQVCDSARIKYTKSPKVGGTIDYLYTETKLSLSLPDKFKVDINGTKFEAVLEWRTQIPEVTPPVVPARNALFKCTIPAGTVVVTTASGLPMQLASDWEAELPNPCPIILPAGTLLQQFSETPGLNFRTRLEFEVEAKLVA